MSDINIYRDDLDIDGVLAIPHNVALYVLTHFGLYTGLYLDQ